jgi:hypothetical protein
MIPCTVIPTAHMRQLVIDDLSQVNAKQYFLKRIPDNKMSLPYSSADVYDVITGLVTSG